MRNVDGDGHITTACPGGDDCDDSDPNRYAGNAEVCDAEGHDEDCRDETVGDTDDDGDGYVSAACCNGPTCGPDCDDGNPAVHPDVVEACNGLDDDCDGSVDLAATPLCPGGTCTGGRCSFSTWDRTVGDPALDDVAWSVAADAAGNIYVAGTFEGMINIGGRSRSSAGSSDAFVICYSPSGAVRWSTYFGTSLGEGIKQIAVGTGGSVFVSGSHAAPYDFGGGLRSAASYVVALSADTGAYLWDRGFPASPSIAPLPDGGVVVAAPHRGTVDVGGPSASDPVGATGFDLHLVRYGADGSYVWDARYGGTGNVSVEDSATSGSSIFVTGTLVGDADLGDGTPRTSYSSDYFISAYALADGSAQWVRVSPSVGMQAGFGIATDGTSVFVVGNNNSIITFAPAASSTASGAVQLWLLSLGVDGSYRWHRAQDATAAAAASGVDIDIGGGAVLAGHFVGTINLGGGAWESTRAGSGPSGFVAYFGNDGGYMSDRAFTAGSEIGSEVYLHDVSTGPGGSVVVVGGFRGSVDFGAGSRLAASTDAVTVRLSR